MVETQIKNRTIFTGDNLSIMRGIESESIDLIYLDPPFNSKHDYSAPIGSKAAGAEFRDIWTYNDIDLAWWGEIEERNPGLYKALDATSHIAGKSMKSYLIYMAVRIIEMHRILNSTGSLYLHCDSTASHYLKVVLDSVFGSSNYRNELIWQRSNAHNGGTKYGRIHDTLLFYTKTNKWIWNPVYGEHDADFVKKFYRKSDKHGKFWTSRLDGKGRSDGESGKPWRGVDPGHRHWSVPRNLPTWFVKPANWDQLGVHARMDILDEQGLVYWSKNQKPSFKQYLSTVKGTSPQDMIYDKKYRKLVGLGSDKKESLGYPTQKPKALLSYIIANSTTPNSVVLDPFCGCATACHAAEGLGRKWIGIDVSEKAYELIKIRLDSGIVKFAAGEITNRTDAPMRGGTQSTNIKHLLYGFQEGMCNGCGIWYRIKDLEVDHIIPTSEYGPDIDENKQLLCGNCNRIKNKRSMEHLIAKLKNNGVEHKTRVWWKDGKIQRANWNK